VTSCTTNGVAYVGNSCAAVWGGGDIGAQINAAIATMPDGGAVYVPSGLYSFTTTIVVPRYITLMGSSSLGTYLHYTASAGCAVAIGDNTSTVHKGMNFNNYSPSGAMQDITLVGDNAANPTCGIYVGGSDGVPSASGTVNTSGASVAGSGFNSSWSAGTPIRINNLMYQIAKVASSSSLTLTTSAGKQAGVPYAVVGSPLTGIDPISNFGDHYHFNRVRVFESANHGSFGTCVKVGKNAWSNTILESVLSFCGTGLWVPSNAVIGNNTGEDLSVVGTSISNNSGIGVQIDAGDFISMSIVNSSIDYNGSWAIQNGTSSSQNAISIYGTYVTNPYRWIQNYGRMYLGGDYFTDGSESGTLGYLIDNEGDNFTVAGGQMFNGGSGVVLNPAGAATAEWFGPLVTGKGSGFPSATAVNIDRFGNGAFANVFAPHGILSVGSGANTVYRCVTAGRNLPTGSLTINSGECGSSDDTGLRVK